MYLFMKEIHETSFQDLKVYNEFYIKFIFHNVSENIKLIIDSEIKSIPYYLINQEIMSIIYENNSLKKLKCHYFFGNSQLISFPSWYWAKLRHNLIYNQCRPFLPFWFLVQYVNLSILSVLRAPIFTTTKG